MSANLKKLSSGHRTGKGQFSFQSQRRAMPKNVQTTRQLHWFHMLVRLCSKSFKLGYSSTWTENFQMNRLDLEKAEELEIKLSTFTRSERKQGNSRKTSVSASLIMLKPLTVQITTNWKILKEMEVPDHLTCLMRNLYVGQEAIVRTRHGITDSFETVFLSLSIFSLYADCIMWNQAWMNHKLGSRLPEEISTTSVVQW